MIVFGKRNIDLKSPEAVLQDMKSFLDMTGSLKPDGAQNIQSQNQNAPDKVCCQMQLRDKNLQKIHHGFKPTTLSYV